MEFDDADIFVSGTTFIRNGGLHGQLSIDAGNNADAQLRFRDWTSGTSYTTRWSMGLDDTDKRFVIKHGYNMFGNNVNYSMGPDVFAIESGSWNSHLYSGSLTLHNGSVSASADSTGSFGYLKFDETDAIKVSGKADVGYISASNSVYTNIFKTGIKSDAHISASGEIYVDSTGGNSANVTIKDSSTNFVKMGIDALNRSYIGWDDSDTLQFGGLTSTSDPYITSTFSMFANGSVSGSGTGSFKSLQVASGEVDFTNLPKANNTSGAGSGTSTGQLFTVSGSQLPFSGSTSELNAVSGALFVMIKQ
jgi:hypothetical protein